MTRILIDSSKTHRDPSTENRRLELFGQLCAEAQRFGALIHPGDAGIAADFPEDRHSGLLSACLFLESASILLSDPAAEAARIRLRIPGQAMADDDTALSTLFHTGISVAPGPLQNFSRYLVTEPLPGSTYRRVQRFRFRKPACPPGEMAAALRPSDLETLRARIRQASASARSVSFEGYESILQGARGYRGAEPRNHDRIAVCVQGSSDMALRLLLFAFQAEYGDQSILFPVISPGSRKRNPFAPILDAIASIVAGASPEEHESPEGNRTLGELNECLAFFRQYPYRISFGSDILDSIARDFGLALDLYASRMKRRDVPAWVILRWPEELSSECLSVLASPRATRAGRGILVAAGSRRPGEDSGRASGCGNPLRIAGMSFFDTIQSVRKSLPKAGIPVSGVSGPDPVALARACLQDPLRLSMVIESASSPGLAPSPESSFEDLAARVLEGLPAEHSRYLVLLSLAEGVLTRSEFLSYLASQGFPKAAVSCIEEYFASMGFISRGAELPKPVFREISSIAKNILGESGESLVSEFLLLLESRLKSGNLRPCQALYRSLAPTPSAEESQSFSSRTAAPDPAHSDARILALESIEEEIALDPTGHGAWNIQDSHCAPWYDFLVSQEAGDRDASFRAERALNENATPGTICKALALLSGACHEYAQSRFSKAASFAKSAILESGSSRPVHIEARAQRVLGLCSLASGQLIQGCAYLSNAADLAQPKEDWLECARAKIAEAGTCLCMGDFARAGLLAGEIALLSRKLRRRFPEEASHFIRGRIDFELGRYGQAAETFRCLALLARDSGHEEIGKRADIWTARCGSRVGDTGLARAILDREYSDPEARWFLAECLLDLGMTGSAAEAAEDAARLAGFRANAIDPATGGEPYRSADRHIWSDGFSSLEGLSVGAGAARSLAAERILAFSLYANSLARPETADTNLTNLMSLARERRLAAVHPYAYLYFYYAYRISLVSECAQASPLSLIGRSFKALQLRAGRLDGEAEFNDFFGSSRENAAIVQAARLSKLM